MKIIYILLSLSLLTTTHAFAQHDSLFYNFQIGLKFGGTYSTMNGAESVNVQDGAGNIFHEIGLPESGLGYNFGVVGLFKLSDLLSLQTELSLVRVSADFSYNTFLSREELGVIEDSRGVYDLKELYFQVPVLLKLVVGEDWKFAFGGGVYYRGAAFSNSQWQYTKTEYGRFISGNWAPEIPPIIKPDLEDQLQLVTANNFGVMVDVGVIRPISKKHSVFVEFRYAYPFQQESDAPIFRQQTLSASLGFLTRIQKITKEDAQERKKKKREGFDF